MLPLAHRSAWLAGGLLLILIVLLGGLAPIPFVPDPPGGDKLHHFVAYACLAVWFIGMIEPRRQYQIALALLLLGGVIEWLQGLRAIGRDREVADLVANATGIALGLGLARLGLTGWCRDIERWLGLDDGR